MLRRTFLQTAAATAMIGSLKMNLPAFAADSAADPMLDPWTGAHGGFPPFDRIAPDLIKPALMKGMELNRAEIEAIAANPEAPTFENTLAAMEDAGRAMDRASSIFNIYTSVLNDKQMQAIDAEMSPVLSAFYDDITQNEALFARIKAVYEGRESAGLTAEQQRLAETVYKNFVRRGAALNATDKARMKAINQTLAGLYTKFGQNVLADEEEDALVLESEADLAGLSPSLIEGYRTSAEGRGMAGKWAVANTRSSMEPFLTYSTRRDLREKGWRMWTRRGDKGGATDNKQVIRDILKLRAERAKLLGFASHAHWATDNNMAGSPDAAMALMMQVWAPAAARAREEIADMQKVADAEGAGIAIEAWDYRFYAEKVRKAKYDVDDNEVKPYLQLGKLVEGMFWASGELFGLSYTKVEDVPVYHPDVTVHEVTREGSRVGLFYFDPYARGGKNSGAWMNAYRTQERFRGETTPIVSNNSNFVKAGAGQPILISWDDASTLFHEFGHALHGLNSSVTYPTLAGTAVKRDFVEFPSQINEHWLPTPEVLSRFAVHAETGAAMPEALVKKIEAAKNFNQGFATVEYLASAIYDMKIHLASASAEIDPEEFEKSALDEIGLPKEIVMRHRPTAFGHIFSGDGYSAGYYVYLWADALTADAWELFAEKGAYDKATARSFLDNVLSAGNAIAPDEAFRRFRGRDVDTGALMRKRGFA
ncbi:MAG: M3 family metallopeptidase [Alphaproteobacteria bacterium]|nr:M3 family metallopeptidase [Alphaproteobacteria bacterium]